MTMDLKPCPFCGSPAEKWSDADHTACSNQDCCAYYFVPLVTQWNTRHADQRIAELEAMAAQLRQQEKLMMDGIASAMESTLRSLKG